MESHTNLSPSAIFCLYFRRNDSIGLIICANNCNHAFNVIILQAESEFKMLMGNKLKISVGADSEISHCGFESQLGYSFIWHDFVSTFFGETHEFSKKITS